MEAGKAFKPADDGYGTGPVGEKAEALSQRIMTYYSTEYASPIGQMTLACNEDGKLVGLWLAGQKYFLGSLKEEECVKLETEGLKKTSAWLDRYFNGEKPQIGELTLGPVGSEFQKSVWKLLCEIPYGQVTTYGEIAKKIAARQGLLSMSAQAVGGAVGHNPISIIIPCHRVIGVNGSLTGYAGGIEKKRWLLQWEGAEIKLPKNF